MIRHAVCAPLAGSDLSSRYAVGLTLMRESTCAAAFRTRSDAIYRPTYLSGAQTVNVSTCFMFGSPIDSRCRCSGLMSL